MDNTIADAAVKTMIDALKADVGALNSQIELAEQDASEDNRNAAIGALTGLDDVLERMGAALVAARAIHRAAH